MEENNSGKGWAIASLILGIVSVICIFLVMTIYGAIVGIIAGVLGIIFAVIAKKKNKSGMSTAGLILSIIGLVLCAIALVGCVSCAGCVSCLDSLETENTSTDISNSNTTENAVVEEKKNSVNTSSDTAINTTTEKEDKTENSIGEGDIGNYHVAIKDYSITYDSSSDAILLVKIAFTNNDDEEQSFAYTLDASAYQNGVELTTPISSYGIDGLDWSKKSKNIKPGVTYEFNIGFYLDDKNEDVEVEIEPYWSFTNGEKVTKILKLKK